MTTPQLPTRYLVGALLGEGGSGRVYRVHDSIRDRDLALKLVTPAEATFLRREFDTLRQIRHENLIQVFDWGVLPSGETYYTMELIEGGDWGRRMGSPQSPDEVRRILTGLLRGLAHLHCHGEIHGDLKPGNILLGAGGVVKITDAGMGGSEGAAAGLSGTPGYAAPEVWEGAKADARSDLYSVGVMAYEALTGRHPFTGRTVREVVSGQMEGWVPSPGAHGIRVPADLERVVMRAVERQAGLRQGSADEFMEGMGVQDRIGEILGGRLIGREREIAEIEALLRSDEPGTPTLVTVDGEPGMGKTVLFEEVAHRAIGGGASVVKLELARSLSLREQIVEAIAAQSKSPAAPTEAAILPQIAQVLADREGGAPFLFWIDPAPEDLGDAESLIRPLARYVWALSLEKKIASRVLFAVGRSGQEATLEPFERQLRLMPHTEDAVLAEIRGILGSVAFEPELVSRLQALTGGNSGALRSAISGLIERRLIDRHQGKWVFREVERIKDLDLPLNANPWTVAWDHLGDSQREAMTVLALLSDDLPRSGAAALGLRDDLMAELESRGWVRSRADRWRCASEVVRQCVIGESTAAIQETAAKRLLRAEGLLDREGRAALALRFDPSIGILPDALWAADEAVKRGDHRAAIARLKDCVAVAQVGGDEEIARDASVRLARALHELGRDMEVLAILNDSKRWDESDQFPRSAGERAHVLGLAQQSLGNLDEARRYLGEAVERHKSRGDREASLTSLADLAELEWRHGAPAARDRAIELLARTLDELPEETGLQEARDALTYHLGAALRLAGRTAEAIEKLKQGLERSGSDYWRMRMSTALGTAMSYSGDRAAGLEWANEAWRYAERAGGDSYKARILSNRGACLYYLGRFREALDQNLLAVTWARRLGNAFEYTAGCAGASIDLLILGRYEEALNQAGETVRTAQQLSDEMYVAKGKELEALALFHIGSYEEAERVAQGGLDFCHEKRYKEVRPRLDWLMGRIALVSGDTAKAENHLEQALTILRQTRDSEDLPGVEIEMNRLRAAQKGAGNAKAILGSLRDTISRSDLPIVQTSAAVAIAEILGNGQLDDRSFRPLLVEMLGLAEECGIADAAWRLGYWLGVLAGRAGDARTAQTRFTHALRILREIAAGLDPDNRTMLLAAPHIRSALAQIGIRE